MTRELADGHLACKVRLDGQSAIAPLSRGINSERNVTTESGGLSRVGQQSELELTELVSRHQTAIWRYLRALGADASLADDLTQDTFLEVMRRPFEQYSDAATASYLRRVAHNLFISRRRREGRMTVTEHAGEFESAWMRWAGFDAGGLALDALAECFKRLTERAQAALKMRFADDSSRQEIAESLGISEHGAKNLMQRAKTQLRQCVEQQIK